MRATIQLIKMGSFYIFGLILDTVEVMTPEPSPLAGTIPPSNTDNRPKIELSEWKWKFHWKNLFLLTYFHILGIHGIYYILKGQVHWKTLIYASVLMLMTSLGVTAGAHRLWAHRAYKAKTPLRVILCIWHTMSLQESLWKWVRNHRMHHKYSDTDADPHNPARGLFFAHMGWLLVLKHPTVLEKCKGLDMSDIKDDPIAMFQHKYYYFLAPLAMVLPVLIPWYFWNENIYISFTTVSMLKVVVILHFTWLVNSAAHRWGTRPYDKTLTSSDNDIVTKLTLGEGWHNFHHAFPWDYRGIEVDRYSGTINTGFIHLMAKIGWAYALKCPSIEMVKARIVRSGEQATKEY